MPGTARTRCLTQLLPAGEDLPSIRVPDEELAERLGQPEQVEQAPAQVPVREHGADESALGRGVAGLEQPDEQQQCLIGVGGRAERLQQAVGIGGEDRLQRGAGEQSLRPVEVDQADAGQLGVTRHRSPVIAGRSRTPRRGRPRRGPSGARRR